MLRIRAVVRFFNVVVVELWGSFPRHSFDDVSIVRASCDDTKKRRMVGGEAGSGNRCVNEIDSLKSDWLLYLRFQGGGGWRVEANS